jgi:hypothetical protein
VEVGPAEIGPIKVSLAEVGPMEVSDVEVSGAEVSGVEVGPLEFRPDGLVLTPPLILRLNASLQDLEMLWVRHRSRPPL